MDSAPYPEALEGRWNERSAKRSDMPDLIRHLLPYDDPASSAG